MKSFKNFINEETMPYAVTGKGIIDINDSAVRDGLNGQISGITNGKFLTPYIALERVSKALANFHIFLPKYTFMEGDSGSAVFDCNQFGLKMGQTDDGQVVTANDNKLFVFFEYRMSDCGMFDVFCEIVDETDLDEILADLEAELNDEGTEEEELDEEVELAGPETGSRKTPGSNEAPMITGITIPNELVSKNRAKMKAKLEKRSLDEEDMVKGPAPKSDDPMVKNLPTLREPGMDADRSAKLAQATQSKSVAGGPVTGADKQAAAQLEERRINEISDRLKARYTKKAESDKKSAERQADFSDGEAKDSGNSPERKKAFGKESEWLKSIVTKRAKGIAMAKKKMDEEAINELSPELVGKVANKRFRQETGLDKAPKKAQTTTAAKTLARAAKKKCLGSNVGVLKP